jgi:uncharacterized protein YecE (DUF72 family)
MWQKEEEEEGASKIEIGAKKSPDFFLFFFKAFQAFCHQASASPK